MKKLIKMFKFSIHILEQVSAVVRTLPEQWREMFERFSLVHFDAIMRLAA